MNSTPTDGTRHARQWYSVEEFWREARRQGAPISRGVAYEGLRRGIIPSVRIGRRIVVPVDAIERMLDASGAPSPSGGDRDRAA